MSLSWNILGAISLLDHLNTSDMELGESIFTRERLEVDGQEQALPTHPQIIPAHLQWRSTPAPKGKRKVYPWF